MKNMLIEKRLIVALVVGGVLLRFAPHPWNFSPVMALALFAGAHLSRKAGIAALFGIMLISDVALGFHRLMPLTWGCFLFAFWLGRPLQSAGMGSRVFLRAIGGSTVFFLVTNLGVFLFNGLYAKTWAGLAQCYWMAMPFFRNMLAGDLIYAFAFFGVYHAVVSRLAPVPVRS